MHIPHGQVITDGLLRTNCRGQISVTEIAQDLVFVESKGQHYTVQLCLGDADLRALILELNRHLSVPLLESPAPRLHSSTDNESAPVDPALAAPAGADSSKRNCPEITLDGSLIEGNTP